MPHIRSGQPVSRPGFSLIELLVAITLSLIMIAIIDRLFLDTTKAVGVGIGLNDIMNNGQTFYDQVQRDASKMLGPTSNGFLVIINKKYAYNSTTQSPMVENSRTGPQPADIRSDQLAFIVANAADDAPMTPGRNDTYYNAARATNSRVWYGHVTRSTTDLGQGIEQYANRWHLGRQQAFLAKTKLGTTTRFFNALNHLSLPNGEIDVIDQDLADILPATGVAATTYYPAVLNYVFAANNGRLRFAPRPTYDHAAADHYDVATVGKMHSDFLANTSDFIVEFAGDLDNDDVIDHDSGQIRWYNGYSDGPIHPFPKNSEVVTPSTTRVYQADATTYSSFDSKYQPIATHPVLADYAFVWRHDNKQIYTSAVAPTVPDKTTNCSWPYMIRIRVRLHDTKGEVVGTTLSNIKDTTTDPVLIANRGKTIPGRWFEQIIKVPRP